MSDNVEKLLRYLELGIFNSRLDTEPKIRRGMRLALLLRTPSLCRLFIV
jgi:hypothetical protein